MITIKRNMKKFNEYALKGVFTLGQLLAMKKALELYSPQSAVCNDVYQSLSFVMEQNNINERSL